MRRIQEYLQDAKNILNLGEEKIIEDINTLRALERNFQLIVECMLDINMHFIREYNFEAPDSLKNTFSILGENKILPYEFAQKIAPLTGLRNKLVHGYEKIDRSKFVRDFMKDEKDFDTYMLAINEQLN
ncbi:MAG: hypothetical protein UU24_C0041G0010 [Candidatus Nomurabacteria bacterium GW2011_GWA2_40_9]|uniref:DUF86 domain-containing protein n=1 Tax=Candidatus Nomurabacteria bacterium GW2011_GWA2_40_9 TaxID=1618734 RepID=A0A0G0TMC4_9BACT|nr:MAG: hypothetical protein UU24_C0041G0010 [Candidatus Nomurabacteria bacterium GW2011_GWA2_40_9]